MPGWLLALAAGALVFYTDDYVIAGVLPEIATGFGVTTAVAGQLVTAFSLTIAAGGAVGGLVLSVGGLGFLPAVSGAAGLLALALFALAAWDPAVHEGDRARP